MSRRDALILKLLVPVVAVAAFWFLALHPRLNQLSKARQNVASARSQLVADQEKLIQVETEHKQLERQKHLAVAGDRAVPATVAMPALLRQLQKTAKHANVQVTSITPGATALATSSATSTATAPTAAVGTVAGPDVTPSLSLATTQLALTYSSDTYAHSQKFLRALAELVKSSGGKFSATGRLLSISDVTLKPGDGGVFNGSITATVYTRQAAAAATTSSTTTDTGA